MLNQKILVVKPFQLDRFLSAKAQNLIGLARFDEKDNGVINKEWSWTEMFNDLSDGYSQDNLEKVNSELPRILHSAQAIEANIKSRKDMVEVRDVIDFVKALFMDLAMPIDVQTKKIEVLCKDTDTTTEKTCVNIEMVFCNKIWSFEVDDFNKNPIALYHIHVKVDGEPKGYLHSSSYEYAHIDDNTNDEFLLSIMTLSGRDALDALYTNHQTNMKG